jgi:hypothetical protein
VKKSQVIESLAPRQRGTRTFLAGKEWRTLSSHHRVVVGVADLNQLDNISDVHYKVIHKSIVLRKKDAKDLLLSHRQAPRVLSKISR